MVQPIKPPLLPVAWSVLLTYAPLNTLKLCSLLRDCHSPHLRVQSTCMLSADPQSKTDTVAAWQTLVQQHDAVHKQHDAVHKQHDAVHKQHDRLLCHYHSCFRPMAWRYFIENVIMNSMQMLTIVWREKTKSKKKKLDSSVFTWRILLISYCPGSC